MSDQIRSETTERWDSEARSVCAKLIPHTTSVHNAKVIAEALAAERERCARRVEQFFAPCSGRVERAYGINLAAAIREGR